MKFNDLIQTLETIIISIIDPMYMRNKIEESDIIKVTKGIGLNNSINVDSKSNNKEYNESILYEDRKSSEDNKSNVYYNKRQDNSSNPQGVIDSITHEMTSVRLQQAIILSEIVGKPRSKTRKRKKL